MYHFFRNILFLFPPEWAHYFSMNCLNLLCRVGFLKKWITNSYKPRGDFKHTLYKIHFHNPVGLGAGFDKNARWLKELECLGFGFVEIGTVTPLPQRGNDKPRLFRLTKDKALINRMGFNNDGVKVIAERLKNWRANRQGLVGSQQSAVSSRQSAVGGQQSKKDQENILQLVIGGNIGKNKDTPNEEAWRDYETCFKELHPYVDYFVVNVSSPNTPGLRALQEKESLRKILLHLHMINNGKAWPKPVLLKIAPDLSQEEIDDVIDLAMEIKLDGIVAANTTIRRAGLATPAPRLSQIGAGGLSGLPLKDRSVGIVRYICERTNGQLPVIASGGIFSGEDAREYLEAGASLVQVWTGFIYEGPAIVKNICKTL